MADVGQEREFSALEWLVEGGPRNEDEAIEVARTLIMRRERVEELKRLDGLTPFERALADRAARAARQAVVRAIEDAIGSAAETVSVPALRQVLNAASGRLDFDPPKLPLSVGFMTHDRVRAAELVAGAEREAERNGTPASGGDR